MPKTKDDQQLEKVLEMHPGLKKVAEFMERELPPGERRAVAKALAVIAPAIWSQHEEIEILPMKLSLPSIQLD